MAPTYALELELMGHANLDLRTRLDDPRYLAMIEAEKRWLASNRNVSDIYTFRKMRRRRHRADGRLRDGLRSRWRVLRRTREPHRLGEVYPHRVPELDRAFEDEISFDRIRHFRPLGNLDLELRSDARCRREVEAVLGIDYDAFLWIKAIARRRLDALAVLSAVLAVILTGLVSVARLRRATAEAESRNLELAAVRDTALAASRTKSQFLASVSHELRTPLHVFLGMNELLLTSSLDERQRRHCETAQRSAEGLLGMVDDLLEFAQLEAGKAPMEEVTFPLGAVLVAAVERHRIAAEHKHLRLHVAEGLDENLQVIGDDRRLRQILRHLLSNAVKFTDAGESARAAGRERTAYGRSSSWWRSKTPASASLPEQRGAVFQRFSQIDPSNTRRHGGTGIGLALSRSLAEQMGGAIEFESEPQRGSVFPGCRPPFGAGGSLFLGRQAECDPGPSKGREEGGGFPNRSSRSSSSAPPGPGGQNVNKVSTAVRLRFDVRSSAVLPTRSKSDFWGSPAGGLRRKARSSCSANAIVRRRRIARTSSRDSRSSSGGRSSHHASAARLARLAPPEPGGCAPSDCRPIASADAATRRPMTEPCACLGSAIRIRQ